MQIQCAASLDKFVECPAMESSSEDENPAIMESSSEDENAALNAEVDELVTMFPGIRVQDVRPGDHNVM